MEPYSTWRSAISSVPLGVRIVTLGLLSWALCAGLPWLYGGAHTEPLDLIALLAGPTMLVFGSQLSQREQTSATLVLLAAFPISLAFGMSRIEHDEALSIYAPSTLLAALLSLAAYGSTALEAAHKSVRLRAVEHKPLGEVAQVAPGTRRTTAARVVLSVLTLGALLVLAYGSSATPAHYREQWGQAANAGAVVAALGAGIVGCVALAILAPGLRAERNEPRPAGDQVKRLTWLLLVAVSGLAVYLLVR